MGRLVLTTVLVLACAFASRAQNLRDDADTDSSDRSTRVAETAASIPSAASPNVSVSMASVSPGPSYLIGPNDLLHISVWKEPDLTATVPVRSDGMISLPLLNDVLASGLTPMQLAAMLTQKLRKYVAAPRVTVVVTQTNSHRIYVIGEVLHTGPIPLLADMTVLQALATSGFTQFANTKRIYVLRNDNGHEVKLPFDYKQVIRGESMSQNIALKPGDTIVVP